ncbi:MAG: LpqN/LpqT family lipoprotein [Mycobacterium sp.]
MGKTVGPTRLALGAVMAVAFAMTGCSASGPSADKCSSVPAQLVDIPTRTDQEPQMRIPLPQGWERTTKMDSESIRFAIRNPALAADGFTPNAVVTLQKVGSDIGKSEKVLEAQNDQLAQKLKLTDMNASPVELCGAPALSATYTAPEVKLSPKVPPIPPRKASSLSSVYKGRDISYIVMVTVQTIKPDNQTFNADSAMILKGFQLLPPG